MKKSTKNLLLVGAAVGVGVYLYKKKKAQTTVAASVAQQSIVASTPSTQAARMAPDDPTIDDSFYVDDTWAYGPATLYGGFGGGRGHRNRGHGHGHGGGHHHH